MTFENSAGPVGQALAINIYADRAIFLNCRFLGWQDTVMTNRNRQYFQDCYIAGHVDFIFGAATVYFKNCEIHCRDKGSITAASTPQTVGVWICFRSLQDYVRSAGELGDSGAAVAAVWGDDFHEYGDGGLHQAGGMGRLG